MEKYKNIFTDPEFWFILVFNGFLAVGYRERLFSQDTLVLIYFMQSIIIGLSNAIRMACLKNYTTNAFTMNGQPVAPTTKTKWASTIFFMIHYGGFHFVYLIFLGAIMVGNDHKLDLKMVFINVCLIAGNALVSTWSNILHDREDKPAITSLFFTPYLRVVPMHIFILVGFTGAMNKRIAGFDLKDIDIFYVFLGLKIVFDLLMHIVVQKSWRGQRKFRPEEGYV